MLAYHTLKHSCPYNGLHPCYLIFNLISFSGIPMSLPILNKLQSEFSFSRLSGSSNSTAKVFASRSILSTEKSVWRFKKGVLTFECLIACPSSWVHVKVRYRVLRAYYFDDCNIQDIVNAEKIDERTYYRDMKDAREKLSALIFGIDGLHNVS